MLTSLWVIGLLLWATAGLAQAHQAPAPASRPHPLAESLTQDLIVLSTRHQQAGPAEQAQLLRDLLAVASERQELLTALIEDDPGSPTVSRIRGATVCHVRTICWMLPLYVNGTHSSRYKVLRVALPADLRASLPAAVQALVEEEMEIEGEFEVLHEDRAGRCADGVLYHDQQFLAGELVPADVAHRRRGRLVHDRLQFDGLRLHDHCESGRGGDSNSRLQYVRLRPPRVRLPFQ